MGKEVEPIGKILQQQAVPNLEKIRSTAPKYTEPIRKISIEVEGREFHNCLCRVEPQFDMAKGDKDILLSIFAWVWRLDSWNILKLDYNKGLFFFGSLGRGKTMTLFALREYLRSLRRRASWYHEKDHRLGTWWLSASQIANKYAAEGQPGLEEYFAPDVCLFIDEMGREPNPASNFGTKMNVIQFLLQMRYDTRRTSVTHVTTNLSLNEISLHYGDYVADRCLEMFNFIEFKGSSYRQ